MASKDGLNMTFGGYIAELRVSKGFKSIRELSRASGVSNATLARMENGSVQPLPETLKLISPFLGISYEKLMCKAGYLEESTTLKRSDNTMTLLERYMYSELNNMVLKIACLLEDDVHYTKEDIVADLIKISDFLSDMANQEIGGKGDATNQDAG
jgi:transcriptional regulator with XRE-family HTH domain